MNPHFGRHLQEDALPERGRGLPAILNNQWVVNYRHLQMLARKAPWSPPPRDQAQWLAWALGEKTTGPRWTPEHVPERRAVVVMEPCSYHYTVHAQRLGRTVTPGVDVLKGIYYEWDARMRCYREREKREDRFPAAELHAAKAFADKLAQEEWRKARVLYVPCTLAAERGARVRRVYDAHTK